MLQIARCLLPHVASWIGCTLPLWLGRALRNQVADETRVRAEQVARKAEGVAYPRHAKRAVVEANARATQEATYSRPGGALAGEGKQAGGERHVEENVSHRHVVCDLRWIPNGSVPVRTRQAKHTAEHATRTCNAERHTSADPSSRRRYASAHTLSCAEPAAGWLHSQAGVTPLVRCESATRFAPQANVSVPCDTRAVRPASIVASRGAAAAVTALIACMSHGTGRHASLGELCGV